MVKKQNVTPLVSDDPDHWGDETTQPSQCMVGEVSPSTYSNGLFYCKVLAPLLITVSRRDVHARLCTVFTRRRAFRVTCMH